MSQIELITDKLRRLRLNNMADHLSDAIEKEKQNNHGFLWLLD